MALVPVLVRHTDVALHSNIVHLWQGAGVEHRGVYMLFGGRNSGRFGVFSLGSFRPLPIPVPGNSYQYFNGSLLYQVAW